MRSIVSLIAAGAIWAGAADAAGATAVYSLTFDNQDGAVNGRVSLTVTLPDGDGTHLAESIVIDAMPPELGYGAAPLDAMTFFGSIWYRIFVVSGGELVDAKVALYNGSTNALWVNMPGDGTFLTLATDGSSRGTGVFDEDNSTLDLSPDPASAAVPLPPAGAALAGGLAGLAAIARRRRPRRAAGAGPATNPAISPA
ncbi:MAG: hypothetical protein VYD87_08085 [Pseudomonadota bacterium]|nr:hypothetical protein [Pseudomonadota bacterium]MEE3098708.1 hypothetical protein [Pseudomonadota bacterium]